MTGEKICFRLNPVIITVSAAADQRLELPLSKRQQSFEISKVASSSTPRRVVAVESDGLPQLLTPPPTDG